MTKKTTQAQKISASWSPNPTAATAMVVAALKGSKAAGMIFSSGRLTLKHAVAINYADPANVQRVSERIAEIKATLSAHGELHGFNVTAGAAPVGEVEVLAPKDAPADE